ncbi:DNA polymerase III subunit delta' [Secundilactobacillus oryzae JCM 18671]|uniref:DNA polymerase III subunit delta n=2 Tax=Secundilactobacillus oryzae TaxID=1202668 RepID=A0A081BK09_9LACO|nr:DNA polymerase III subunit delta' [Secundilactobacillus oryzae]GAK48377.1 DNA polymerase III subunit delta' [Secundilactobacillus oryzae JCM 18671]
MSKEAIERIITKQPKLAQHFMTVIGENELTHAYLFVGESGSGQVALAELIAMRLFCHNVDDTGMPCGVCYECQRIQTQEHPDVVEVKPDGQSIKVDQVRFLKSEFSKSAVEGNQKVFIVADAEKMTTSAANSLLKFIEEPTGNTIAILTTSNRSLILPTILSRTQIVEFPKLSLTQLRESAIESGIAKSTVNLAMAITNDIEQMKQFSENDWLAQVQVAVGKWFSKLTQRDDMAVIQIATDIMPLAQDKASQQVILDAMTAIWHETLNQHFQLKTAEQSAFPQQKAIIDKARLAINQRQLISIIQDCLETRREFLGNIGFQSIVESLTLKILSQLA